MRQRQTRDTAGPARTRAACLRRVPGTASWLACCLLLACVCCLAGPAQAEEPMRYSLNQSSGAQSASPALTQGQTTDDLGQTGAKLANPLSNLWALNMDFHLPQFFSGDAATNGTQLGASMYFQPVMPIPLYGTGANELKLVTRPVIPIVFTQPVPDGLGGVDRAGGLGDIQLPLLLAVPDRIAGSFILGAGPVGILPTATDHRLGKGQWALGPAMVLGFKNALLTAGIFPNYFWKVGSSDQEDYPDINQGSLFYFLTFNLPDAWQVGMNPTITYDHTASDGNQWTVPVGLFVGKTTKIGSTPVNIKFGFEYSVVSPDDYGQCAQIRLQITPVIESLISKPLFGE